MSVVFWMRRREELLSIAFRSKGNGRREGGLSRTSVGKVKVKLKKSSKSLLFPDKKKSCFNFQSSSSGSTDFNSNLPVPVFKVLKVLKDLKGADLSAACSARNETELLGHFCSEASLAHRGQGVHPKPLRSRVRVAENVFSDSGHGGSVRLSSACIASQCRHSRLAGGCAENDFLGVVTDCWY